ncbi:uncharacterized protein LOC132285898 [Cornus florida]|uniref:uncharacterized protein LOC132285898 n=1 Tax=Cornus florida TaxID=4283 RepID=UPI00289C6FE7|nr:uncharacterized protein LOC132285898 [Cornus florida]
MDRVPYMSPREHLFGSCCAVDCRGILYWRFSSIFFVLDPYNPNHPHGTIDMPKEYDSKAGKHAVGECKGHLRFAQFKGYRITIWELNDNNYSDGVEWSLVHMLLPKVHSLVSPLTVVAFHPRDSDILYLWLPDRIMHCNVWRSREFKTVCELANSRASRFLYTMVFPFMLPWWPTPVPPIPHTVLGRLGEMGLKEEEFK